MSKNKKETSKTYLITRAGLELLNVSKDAGKCLVADRNGKNEYIYHTRCFVNPDAKIIKQHGGIAKVNKK